MEPKDHYDLFLLFLFFIGNKSKLKEIFCLKQNEEKYFFIFYTFFLIQLSIMIFYMKFLEI